MTLDEMTAFSKLLHTDACAALQQFSEQHGDAIRAIEKLEKPPKYGTRVYAKNRVLLDDAIEVLQKEQPCTLRQLYYRLMSRGSLKNSQREYQRLGKLMTRARENGDFSRRWIVDHVRATLKPSSWTGLAEYVDTVRDHYRRDFWASLDHHVAVFVEKDAVAGTVQPVTSANDVSLHVCRGYASVSFVGEIADEWKEIQKPIFAYYLGDFDPSGFDIERDLKEKLQTYSGKTVFDTNKFESPLETQDKTDRRIWWTRLGVLPEDFDDFNLIRLPIKRSDSRANGFIQAYGDSGAEIDAIPPTELRRRVTEAIDQHIDVDRWNALIDVEKAERETFQRSLAGIGISKSASRSHLGGEVSE